MCVLFFSNSSDFIEIYPLVGCFFTHVVSSWQHVSFFFIISFLFCILHIFLSHFSSFDVSLCYSIFWFVFFFNWIFLDAANIIINFLSRYLIRLVYEFDWIVRARFLEYWLFIIYVLVQSEKNNNNNYNNRKKHAEKQNHNEKSNNTAQHSWRRQRPISMYVSTSVWVVNNKRTAANESLLSTRRFKLPTKTKFKVIL